MSSDELGAKVLELFERAQTDKDGRIHIQTLLSTLGAHAGFGCQFAVRDAIRMGALPAAGALIEVTSNDGGKFYFGDQLNQPLLEAPVNVWRIVAGGAIHAGAKLEDLPDPHEIAAFVTRSATTNTPPFGTIRVPAHHQPFQSPIVALQGNWLTALKYVTLLGNHTLATGWHFALAAQKLIIKGKDIIDPAIATRIVMETAVAMAKIDPDRIGEKAMAHPLLRS